MESVNTWPVLATPEDDAVLGAAIVLPDHPQLAPESRGNLFDTTEIEEALLLHVHALSDAEREQATGRDPAVGEMLARALATTPEEILALHGRLRGCRCRPLPGAGADEVPAVGGPPAPVLTGLPAVGGPPAPVCRPDDVPGESADGRRGDVRRGATVVLRPGVDRDPFDRMLDGRRATLERIYLDYDDRVYLAVTVDDDPGQELMRETGRYLFFFANEVQTP